MEEKNSVKKREWIKNAIIIFLVVMLFLTFFSNTIMQYTLPEVATSYVQSGSITEKVRGSGNVTASDPYDVMSTETRVISSVAIKQGDHVEKGDVIYYLEDKDSTELSKAQGELSELKFNYLTALLASKMDAGMAVDVEEDGLGSFEDYAAMLQKAQNAVDACQAAVEKAQADLDQATVGKATDAARQIGTLDPYDLEKQIQQQNKTDAAAAYAAMKTAMLAECQNNINKYTAQKTAAEGATQTGDITAVRTAVKNIGIAINPHDLTNFDDMSITQLEEKLSEYNQLKGTDPDYTYLFNEANNSINNYNNNATAIVTNYDSDIEYWQERYNEINEQVFENTESYKDLISKYNQAVTNYNNMKAQNEKVQADYTAAVTANTAVVAAAKDALTLAKAEYDELVNDISQALKADRYSEDIERKEEEIAKLEANAMGATVTAPVTGTVSLVAHVAGESTKVDETIATIMPDGKGYTVQFAVTNEQARKVSVGDMAEIGNSWYYSDAVATVKSIAPDPDNVGKKQLITFDLTGETIQAGQNLTLSVGSQTQNYDVIVPNSAIKEESSGKFVLKLIVKSSPLGNRYIAQKVEVKVLASDDKNSAISGDISAYEYVITTSNLPVSSGSQVKLAQE